MRFLVAIASLVLGGALLAGFIYRDAPLDETAILQPPKPVLQTTRQAKPAVIPSAPIIIAPKVVGDIAAAQPTILNADRSRFGAVSAAPEPTPVTQDEQARRQRILVMALQGELRRVGCYEGAIDGQWASKSKAAMYWFLKRVNAKLPVSKPEETQLNLLKSADKDFCVEQPVQPDFVTKVVPADEVAAGIPNPTTTIQNDAFSDARRRAGLPRDGRVALDGSATGMNDVALPEPMAVGRVEETKKRRRYRARSRRVETLFKHPLGRF